MSDLGWVVFQVFYIFLKFRHRKSTDVCLLVLPLMLLPTAALGDRTAFFEVSNRAQSGSLRAARDGSPELHLKLRGSFAQAGEVKAAEGNLHQFDCAGSDDEEAEGRPKDDWVAILDYSHTPHSATNDSQCHSVIDRVKKAMLFGASAIIILAMHPRFMKELDIAQLFSRPVVLVQEVENVTAVLGALASKLKLRVKLAYNTSYYDLLKVTTLTLWATCGRSNGVDSYNEWEGVVCLGQGESKADPGQFWYYFFSALGMILLLLVIKSKHGRGISPDSIEHSLQLLAGQALQVMPCSRYSRNHANQEENDRCAVCLDYFQINQQIRELPCSHEFHAKCVDKWLILQRTCPLCKRNILDNQSLAACM